MLSVLPEVDVGVVEDVRPLVEVVEGLRGQYHPYIIPSIKQRQSLEVEVLVGHLIGIKNGNHLIRWDCPVTRVDHLQAVVEIS